MNHASTTRPERALRGPWDASGTKTRLLQSSYPELRRIARRYLMRERSGHTLQATALVHEAFLRLTDQTGPAHNQAHFVALTAQMMRRVLINHALSRKAEKRGGGQEHIPIDDDLPIAAITEDLVDMVDLDQALTELQALDARQARVVELRYFVGLSIEETAQAMRLSPATVKRDWVTAKIWLKSRLER